jgi:hypothetical protein
MTRPPLDLLLKLATTRAGPIATVDSTVTETDLTLSASLSVCIVVAEENPRESRSKPFHSFLYTRPRSTERHSHLLTFSVYPHLPTMFITRISLAPRKIAAAAVEKKRWSFSASHLRESRTTALSSLGELLPVWLVDGCSINICACLATPYQILATPCQIDLRLTMAYSC